MRTRHAANRPSARPLPGQIATPETIAVVDANADVLAFVESALAGQCYNVLLLESRAHAHAEIKRLRPSVVVLCTSFDMLAGCQLLTMLNLDKETREIPVVTLAIQDDANDEDAEGAGAPVFSASPQLPAC
jgi:PleD family two-component response regulator